MEEEGKGFYDVRVSHHGWAIYRYQADSTEEAREMAARGDIPDEYRLAGSGMGREITVERSTDQTTPLPKLRKRQRREGGRR